jgi:tricorn protease
VKHLTLSLFAALCAAVPSFAQNGVPTLFRQPAISRGEIAFSYAGDLWLVPRSGGDARRLTTGVGIESNPYFSPDGTWIAFSGEYDGNVDAYIVSAAGGIPKRLTYHPSADRVSGWTPDGKSVMFASTRSSNSNYSRLFTFAIDGKGLPAEVPLPMADRGWLSPDGTSIAYEPLSQWQSDWKHYQGGQTQPIWIAKLADSTIQKVPRENSNDKCPMWVGDKIYFLSDRNGGTVSLFAYDTGSKRVDPVVEVTGLDIKYASAGGGGAIVYEQFGAIYVVENGSKSAKKVDIRVAGDFPGVRSRYEKVGGRIANSAVSPTGVRAVFEARGEIISAPADKGDARNLTNTPNVMERDPSWSPDGRWIAYFSDESGEYALHLRDQTGMGEVRKIKLGDGTPGFYSSAVWSPDSKKIAYNRQDVSLWVLDVEKGTSTRIDKNTYGDFGDVVEPSWSPDGKWITYSKQLDNRLRAVYLYSLDNNKANQITDGLGDARHVVFDKSGKYVYFSASTNVGPTISFADLSGIAHQTTRNVYAIVLRNDMPSPLAPESDEEKVQPEKKDEPPVTLPSVTPTPAPSHAPSPSAADSPAAAPAEQPKPSPAAQPKKPEVTRVDLENIDQRVIAISQIPARNYSGLFPAKAGILYVTEIPVAPQTGPFGQTLHKYDLEKRKFEEVRPGVNNFHVSANGEKMLYQQGPGWNLVSTTVPTPPGQGIVKTAEMEVFVDPRVEWKQMFNEIWRGERDFFYDPNTHGLDIEKAKQLYRPYVDVIAHRDDLNYLFREMLNQIGVGHMFIGGGDQPQPNFVPGGLLGADYKIENGRYRFARVYNGENWNPQLRAPLTAPGVNVKAGEYLVAVNGRDVRSDNNLYQMFESTANRQVVIRVGSSPDGKDARQVTVVPVGSENGLRNLAWIEDNRRKVDQLSGGQLGYVYIPNTGGPGYTSFNRYFFAQTNKHGAVIDERFNSGGLLADYVVEYLNRQQLAKIAFRDGKDWNVPAGAIYGPKAMLVNELAGSGGDAMPWFFKKLKIGPVIGKRTWGGLVRASGIPTLMDGGNIRAPNGAVYGLNGEWEVENVGVAPDIEVEFDPAAWRAGRDPQLEKAVEWLLEELKKNPPKDYKRPPYPDYQKGTGLGREIP